MIAVQRGYSRFFVEAGIDNIGHAPDNIDVHRCSNT
jgi:hypothetical protein